MNQWNLHRSEREEVAFFPIDTLARKWENVLEEYVMTEIRPAINKQEATRIDIYDWLLRNLGSENNSVNLDDLYFFENLVSDIFYDNSWNDDFEIPVRDTIKWLLRMNDFAPYSIQNVNVISLKPNMIIEDIFSFDATKVNSGFSKKKLIDQSGTSTIDLLISSAMIYATQENIKRYYEIVPAGIRYVPNGHLFSFVIIAPDPSGKPFSQVMLEFSRLISLLSDVYQGVLEYVEDRIMEDNSFPQFNANPISNDEVWTCLDCISSENPLINTRLCRFCDPIDRDALREMITTISIDLLVDSGLAMNDNDSEIVSERLENVLSQIETQLNITRDWIERIKYSTRR